MDVSCPAENGGGGATTGWYRVIHTRCCDPVCASELFTYIYIYIHTHVCMRARGLRNTGSLAQTTLLSHEVRVYYRGEKSYIEDRRE